MEPTDQLQIVIQYFVEVSALFSCFCQYHRQMQGYHANVEASHKYRFVSIKTPGAYRLVRTRETEMLCSPWGR